MVVYFKKTLYWFPRIVSFLFALFIGMFSLDSFDGKSSIGDQFIGFAIHNIPTVIILIISIISLKKDIVGAVFFFLISVILIYITGNKLDVARFFLLVFPALLISLLFVYNYIMVKRSNN